MRRWLVQSHFTPAQRVGMIGLIVIGVVTVAQRDRSWKVTIADPLPIGHRATDLVGKLDPNTAEATALVAIPGLGERRSRDIVAFRQKPDAAGNPFIYRQLNDLMKVRGIGPALSKQMEPYLVFPDENADDGIGSQATPSPRTAP